MPKGILGVLLMGFIFLNIGGVDYSDYVRGAAVEGSGPGHTGQATLYLDKQAGGLDILGMQEVKLWIPYIGTNGVAQHGRLFGGLVQTRRTGNYGTWKTWDLTCATYNLLLSKVVKDAGSTVYLAAGTFAAQVQSLVQSIQERGYGAVARPIDASSNVANLYATMPVMNLEGGHSLGWYLKKLCDKAQELSPGINPKFFIDTARTFGAVETFGNPTLHVYDANTSGAVAYAFSDVPGVGEYRIYPDWERPVDSTVLVQRMQSYLVDPPVVYEYHDDAAQAAYPCPFVNHGRPGNTGYWMDEAFEEEHGVDPTKGLQHLKRLVDPKKYPKERPQFWTDQRVQVGETVTVTYALEGLSAVNYRVTGAVYDFTDPVNIWTHLELATRRLLLYEDDDSVDAPPAEGDPYPPEPPSDFQLTASDANIWDPAEGRAKLTFGIWSSPSPDVAFYRIYEKTSGRLIQDNIAVNGSPTPVDLPWLFDHPYSLVARAVDSHGNQSTDSPNASGTAPHPSPAAPANFAVLSWSYEETTGWWCQFGWTASTYNWETGYEVYGYLAADPTVHLWHTVPNEVQTLVPDIPFGDWRFKIRTLTKGWAGPWSGEISKQVDPLVCDDLRNPSFEVASKKDPAKPDWWAWTTAAGGVVERVLGGHSGQWTARLRTVDVLGSAALQTPYMASAPATTYTLRWWHYEVLGSGSPTYQLKVRYYDALKALLSTDTFALGSMLDNWRQGSQTFSTPANTRYMTLEWSFSGAYATVDLDEASLVKQEPAGILLADQSPSSSGTYNSKVQVDSRGLVTSGAWTAGLVEAHYHVQATSDYTANPEPASDTDVDSMTLTFTVPTGGRTVRVSCDCRLTKTAGSSRVRVTDSSGNTIYTPVNTAQYRAWWSNGGNQDGEQEIRFAQYMNLSAGTYTMKLRHQAAQSTAQVTYHERSLTVDVLTGVGAGG